MNQKNNSSNESQQTHWILLRGLARESRHWGSFPELFQSALRENGTEARVDCIDLPGTGRYSEMKSPVVISEITEFVREKYLEIRQRQRESGESPRSKSFLVAVSLGGIVASDWLERWPEDFAACTLINTSFKGYSPFYQRLSPEAFLRLLDILRGKTAAEREERVLRLVSNRPEIYKETATAWAKIFEDRPVSYENFARQLMAAARYQPSLHSPVVPVLVLNSKNDRMVHSSCSEQIASRWGAVLRCHPTAGHDLPLDEAEWVIEQICDWYRDLSS